VPDAFLVELLGIVEINTANQRSTHVVFDTDDIDAALEELDARYLAGEAAAHPHTWSLVAGAYAALNRHDLPATTADYVNIDHRRVTSFAPADIKAYTLSAFNQIPDLAFRIEAVHQLSSLGAVVTQALRGTSQTGFEGEWREIHLMTIEGNLFNRSEMFDEADIDAALAKFVELHRPQQLQNAAKFEELSRPASRLENTASRVAQRYQAHFVTRDWDAMAQLLAHDSSIDDRRRTVNSGITHGRDAEIEEWRAAADVGFTDATADVIAIRGERMALTHARYSARG
jgi:hypothetical protein